MTKYNRNGPEMGLWEKQHRSHSVTGSVYSTESTIFCLVIMIWQSMQDMDIRGSWGRTEGNLALCNCKINTTNFKMKG